MAKTTRGRARKPPTSPQEASWHLQLRGSPNDNESHAIARGTFLRLICRDDPRVAELFQWGGVLAAAEALAAEGDRLAARVGLQHRGELIAGDFGASDDETAFVHDAWAWVEACRGFWRQQQQTMAAFPSRDLVRHTWRLSWAWLEVELVKVFTHRINATLVHGRVTIDYEVEPTFAAVPEFHFKPAANETPTESLKRLKELLRDVTARVSPTPIDRRGVRPDHETITRDVGWFYRAVLKPQTDSISALAREYHATAHQGRVVVDRLPRKAVREGIKRARYLLEHVPRFRYAPLGKSPTP